MVDDSNKLLTAARIKEMQDAESDRDEARNVAGLAHEVIKIQERELAALQSATPGDLKEVAAELDAIAGREERALTELAETGIQVSDVNLNYPSEQRAMSAKLRAHRCGTGLSEGDLDGIEGCGNLLAVKGQRESADWLRDFVDRHRAARQGGEEPPTWGDHPVDVLEDMAGGLGYELDPDQVKKMREICDAEQPATPGDLESVAAEIEEHITCTRRYSESFGLPDTHLALEAKWAAKLRAHRCSGLSEEDVETLLEAGRTIHRHAHCDERVIVNRLRAIANRQGGE